MRYIHTEIDLFSSSGIGDLGLRKNGIKPVIACELLKNRARLYESNFPQTKMFCGDIWKLQKNIIEFYKKKFTKRPFLIMATPPCQGMSLTGMGKMLNDYRNGKKDSFNPKFDNRNRLIIPTINIIKALKPKWIIMENVPNLKNTLIYDENHKLISILKYIFINLKDYVKSCNVINLADYGVPQNRKRLITILSRDTNAKTYLSNNDNNSFLPIEDHSKYGNLFMKPWVTVRDAIGGLPPLESKKGKNKDIDFNPLHFVPIVDKKKYFWISHTPEGKTAFDNQCINPECMYQGNPILKSKRNKKSGITTTSIRRLPLYCVKCGHLLPRPYVIRKDGHRHIMRGYVSAYKRMWWDKPASTITTRFQFPSSDNNLHPSQNRVLSLYEGTVLQTISRYKYTWKVNNKLVNIGLIRDSIGESVPPLLIDKISKQIIEISDSNI